MTKLLLLELNEFSPALLRDGAERWNLGSIRRLLALHHVRTFSPEQREHHGLDPWAQWASVHTGRPLAEHGLKRLGDVAHVRHDQLWEVLGTRGVSCGVWGAMNAARRNSAHTVFFLPDPWTFSEDAFPADLNAFLALPRYYAKHYLDTSTATLARKALQMAGFVVKKGLAGAMLRELRLLGAPVLRARVNNAILFSQFDLVNTLVFLKYHRTFKTDFNVLFLNSVAHLQHHAWQAGDPGYEMEYGLKVVDRILELLFARLAPGEDLLVMNALGQRNIQGEKTDVLYRQIDPERFLHAMNIPFSRVEQCMTNDGHVFFSTRAERDHSMTRLREASIEGMPMFDVEADPHDERSLFYQLAWWRPGALKLEFVFDGRDFPFSDHFEEVAVRTGEHQPAGDIFTTLSDLEGPLENRRVFDLVVDAFSARSSQEAM